MDDHQEKKLQAYEGDILKTEPTKKGNIASSVYTILGVNGVIVGVLFDGYPNAWIHSSHRKIPPSASATIHIIHRSISTHSKANICNITAEHRFSQKSHVFLQPLDFPGRSISIHVKTPWPWNIPLLQAEAAINQDVPAALPRMLYPDSVPQVPFQTSQVKLANHREKPIYSSVNRFLASSIIEEIWNATNQSAFRCKYFFDSWQYWD